MGIAAFVPVLTVPSVAVPTYFGDFDGADTTAWVRVVDGVFTETKSGNTDSIATGDIITVSNATVGDVQAVQFDGVAEYASFAATADYFSGITTKCTVDLIARPDTQSNLAKYACISSSNDVNDDNDVFSIRMGGTTLLAGAFRTSGGTDLAFNAPPIVNGTTYHFRVAIDTTVALQEIRLFANDMSTPIDTTAVTLDATLKNAGVTPLTFAATDVPNLHGATTILEFMVRDGYHTDQLDAFS